MTVDGLRLLYAMWRGVSPHHESPAVYERLELAAGVTAALASVDGPGPRPCPRPGCRGSGRRWRCTALGACHLPFCLAGARTLAAV